MKTATERLHDLIRRDIESGSKGFALDHGHEWFNLSSAEAEVFNLELDDLPSLVAVWCAYEAVLSVCDMIEISDDLREAFFREQAWLDPYRSGPTIDVGSFQKFAALFGVPYRKSHAWFGKYDFYTVRAGIACFADEGGGDQETAAKVSKLDAEIPF